MYLETAILMKKTHTHTHQKKVGTASGTCILGGVELTYIVQRDGVDRDVVNPAHTEICSLRSHLFCFREPGRE